MPPPDVPPCYLCGSARTDLVVANPQYSYVHCTDCGYRRKDQLPTAAEEERLYEDDYYTDRGLVVGLQSQSALMRGLIESRVRMLTELNGGPGLLLDVGAGTGLFMEASLIAGWTAKGLDTSAAAVEIARRITRANVIRGGIEDVPEDAKFDAITLWDVLEHLADPRANLVRIRQLLRTGGLVAISLPNVDGLKARALGTLLPARGRAHLALLNEDDCAHPSSGGLRAGADQECWPGQSRQAIRPQSGGGQGVSSRAQHAAGGRRLGPGDPWHG